MYRTTAQQRIREIDALRPLAQNSRDLMHSLSYIQSAITAVVGKYKKVSTDERDRIAFNGMPRAQLRGFQVMRPKRARVLRDGTLRW